MESDPGGGGDMANKPMEENVKSPNEAATDNSQQPTELEVNESSPSKVSSNNKADDDMVDVEKKTYDPRDYSDSTTKSQDSQDDKRQMEAAQALFSAFGQEQKSGVKQPPPKADNNTFQPEKGDENIGGIDPIDKKNKKFDDQSGEASTSAEGKIDVVKSDQGEIPRNGEPLSLGTEKNSSAKDATNLKEKEKEKTSQADVNSHQKETRTDSKLLSNDKSDYKHAPPTDFIQAEEAIHYDFSEIKSRFKDVVKVEETTENKVRVRFHVLIAPDFEFSYNEHILAVHFGPPIGDFTEHNVLMEPCENSQYANDNKLQYYVGSVFLPNTLRGQFLPYSYYVWSDMYNGQCHKFDKEHLYSVNEKACRCLRVGLDVKKHEQYDDIVCKYTKPRKLGNMPITYNDAKENKVITWRPKASKAMLSLICQELAKTKDLDGSRLAMEEIIQRHKNYTTCMYKEWQYWEINEGGVIASYKMDDIVIHLINDTLEHTRKHLRSDAREEALCLALFLCLQIHKYRSLPIIIHYSDICPPLFEICARTISSFMDSEFFLKLCHTKLHDSGVLAKAICYVVNGFLGRTWSEQTTDKKGRWILVLPLLHKLGNGELDINYSRWHNLAGNNHHTLDQFLQLDEFRSRFPTIDATLLKCLNDFELWEALGRPKMKDFFTNIPLDQLLQRCLPLYNKRFSKKMVTQVMADLGSFLKTILCSRQEMAIVKSEEIDNCFEFLKRFMTGVQVHHGLLVFTIGNLLSLPHHPTKKDDRDVVTSLYCKAFLQEYQDVQHLTRTSWTFWKTFLEQVVHFRGKSLIKPDTEEKVMEKLGSLLKRAENDDLLVFFEEADLSVISTILLERASCMFAEKNNFKFLKFMDKYVKTQKLKNKVKMVEVLMRQASCPVDTPAQVIKYICENQKVCNAFQIAEMVKDNHLSHKTKESFMVDVQKYRKAMEGFLDLQITIEKSYHLLNSEEEWERLVTVLTMASATRTDEGISEISKTQLSQVRSKLAKLCQKREYLLDMTELLKSKSKKDPDISLLEAKLAVGNEKRSLVKEFASNIDKAFGDYSVQEMIDVTWVSEWSKESIILNMELTRRIETGRGLLCEREVSHTSKNNENADSDTEMEHSTLRAISRVRGDFCNFLELLSQSSMSIKNIASHFEELWKKKLLKKELNTFGKILKETGWIGQVERQIDALFRLRRRENSASLIRDICKVLQCTITDSQTLNFLRDNNDAVLKNLPEEVLEDGDIFSEWKESELECLRVIETSGALITWVKSNMDDKKELKVFVELATIDAGESALDVEKILSFQRAINGYAPLIFDLPMQCDLKYVLKACKEVFAAFEQDGQLPNALKDSSYQLPWIQDVSDRHGSVESSSVNEVQHIVENGKFRVSTKKASQDLGQMIYLEADMPEQSSGNREADIKTWSYANLCELRSKLMLITVAEEGRQSAVDIFVSRLGQIEQIAILLQDLLACGCHLYSKFELECHLQSHNSHAFSVMLTFESVIIHLTERPDSDLEKVIAFLENCAEDWKDYVKEARTEFPSLNYYTADQLVKLSDGLASAAYKGINLTPELFMLLQYSCPLLRKHDLGRIIQRIKEREGSQAGTLAHTAEIKNDTDPDENYAEFKDLELWRELVEDYDYPESVVLNCFRQLKKKEVEANIDNCLEWLKDKEEGSTDESDEEVHCEEDNELLLEENFGDELSTVWRAFIKNQKKHEEVNFINFRILAEQLQWAMDIYGLKPDRPFPAYLQGGKPNLVTCSTCDIYKAALALYQSDPSKPLPTLAEILVCNEKTPTEQVELICRRALHDRSGKIFVVLHAHLLNFDVGVRIEELFSDAKVTNENYRLVFVSNNEANEYSYITTAFDKHTVSLPPLPSHEEISSYLESHLKKDKEETHDNSYIRTDPENSRFRLIVSQDAGNGKTLYVRRQQNKIRGGHRISIQMHEKEVDLGHIIDTWSSTIGETEESCIYHIDFAQTIPGKDDLIFQLAVLGGLLDASGKLWVCWANDLYLIEANSRRQIQKEIEKNKELLMSVLPSIHCLPPVETTEEVEANQNSHSTEVLISKNNKQLVQLLDEKTYRSPVMQRPYHYLTLYASKDPSIENYVYHNVAASQNESSKCLKVLLEFCPIKNPSWTELMHFVAFLNFQLESTEKSIFCQLWQIKRDLPGFKLFIIRCVIQMANDFATRSIEISDESHGGGFCKPTIKDRSKWEKSPHPYVCFNADGTTFSFFGLYIRETNLCLEGTDEVLERDIMSLNLKASLERNGVQFNQSFDSLTRKAKLEKLCLVFGITPDPPFDDANNEYFDPDPSYELTYDNVLKMLAIHMRFRSNIPVIIMGETGSGKTRLVKFMCDLQKGGKEVTNMVILKTHGGITAKTIEEKVLKAIDLAKKNRTIGIDQTILFFDEANTTNAISVIKNIMCDHILKGEDIDEKCLKFVAALNPYREHCPDMIEKLEKAGLGYHIKVEDTQDCLGKIPMRRLVYRVAEMPESMFPLIWDFGTLPSEPERCYIKQMILTRRGNADSGAAIDLSFMEEDYIVLLVNVLSKSQQYMRDQKDECSFISLRDVERTLDVLVWFHSRTDLIHRNLRIRDTPDFIVSLALALGVAYVVKLDRRDEYYSQISSAFKESGYKLGKNRLIKIINSCQDLFIDELKLDQSIAKNDALKENVWMMAICIELKIPLFLVGKPGSSKSLAKTVVSDVMQGQQSYSSLFRNFKEAHMVSFQCSPLATAGGVHGTFLQCQMFQEKRNLNEFTSVVVLDEVGLAEDSKNMPLKSLHPLLENGCIDDDETYGEHKKVAFVGISNWALDPAKMNRGILVSRGVPQENDLMKTAKGICSSEIAVRGKMTSTIRKMTKGYQAVHLRQEREYFGLRDFYSVIKMTFAMALRKRDVPSDSELCEIVRRNFGGYFGDFDPTEVFMEELQLNSDACLRDALSSSDLIIKAIQTGNANTRYILLLTKNGAALRILQDQNVLDQDKTIIIFGSSFPRDQEYTQICSNINRIKIAMELGQTVVLCNLNNLYESLYDALNQNYVTYGGKKYVDLGLGTHRVKCRVHDDFRLILVAEDKDVYEIFPIPLINRMEKHFLTMETITDPAQKRLLDTTREWTRQFCEVKADIHQRGRMRQFTPGDVFIGYHDDLVASVTLKYQEEIGDGTYVKEGEEGILSKVKESLLMCATPDALSRLPETRLPDEEKEWLFDTYYIRQKHSCLSDFLVSLPTEKSSLVQVTTTSRLLTANGKAKIAQEMGIRSKKIILVSLVQFSTEEQFNKKVAEFLKGETKIMLIQSEVWNEEHQNLVNCARYNVQELLRKACAKNDSVLNSMIKQIVFLLYVPRVAGGCFSGICAQPWINCHVDELRKLDDGSHIDMSKLKDLTIPEAFELGLVDLEKMIIQCLPKAAAVTVADGKRDRPATRLEILIRLIESDSETSKSFLEALRLSVIHTLNINNGRSNPLGSQWLIRMAMNSEFLREGNTFQKSIWLYIKGKISPILRDILTFCDLDNSLDLLADNEMPLWLQQAFVEILSAFASNDISTGSASFLGSQGGFSCTFPLSRFVICAIDSWQVHDNEDSQDFYRLQALLQGQSYSETVKLCFCQHPSESLKRYINDFVHIKMFQFTNISDKVTKFLCKQLLKLSTMVQKERTGHSNLTDSPSPSHTAEESPEDHNHTEETSQDNEETVGAVSIAISNDEDTDAWDRSISPVDVHIAFLKYKSRLVFLGEICGLLPNDSPMLAEVADDDNTFTADYKALLELMRHYGPFEKKWDIMTVSGREEWISSIKTLQHMHMQIRAFDTPPHAAEILAEIKASLRRLTVVQKYLSHVSSARTTDASLIEIVCRRAKRLNVVMDPKDNNLKKEKVFGKIVEFMEKLNQFVAKEVFKGQDICIICKKDMADPVQLNCNHWGCLNCLKKHFDDRKDQVSQVCPVPSCQEKIPKQIRLSSSPASKEASEKHADFKGRLGAFFLDLLRNYVFHGSQPDEQVIQTLMTFVMTEEFVDDEGIQTTKQCGPFAGHSIDSTPVIRSFLLQVMLLQKDYEMSYHNLSVLLQKEKKMVKNPKSYMELCLLIIYCLEDRLLMSEDKPMKHGEHGFWNVVPPGIALKWLRESSEQDKCMVCKMMLQSETCQQFQCGHWACQECKETTQYDICPKRSCQKNAASQESTKPSIFKETIETLANIAKSRLAAICVASTLRDIMNSEEGGQVIDEAKKIFLDEFSAVIKAHPHANNIKKYLVRLLVKQYRKDAVDQWRRRKLVPELFPGNLTDGASERVDNYLVLGERYKNIRDSLRQAIEKNQFEQHVALIRTEGNFRLEWVLAHHFLMVQKSPCDSVDMTTDEVDQAMRQAFPEGIFYEEDMLRPNLEEMYNTNNLERMQGILNIIFHFGAVLFCSRVGEENVILSSLAKFVADPLSAPYLPTMAQDDNALEVLQAMRNAWNNQDQRKDVTAWYKCSNGHIYAVGNCGAFNRQGKCPDCKEVVGYPAYAPNAIRLNVNDLEKDSTPTGYTLDLAERKALVAVRALSSLEVSITRFLLHAAMALNSLSGVEKLVQVIKPKVQDTEVVGFIQQNLSSDLKDVSSQMGRSEDEAQILLHKVVQTLLHGVQGDGNLESREGREEWERTLSVLLKHEIGELDQSIEDIESIRSQERQEHRDKTAEADDAIIKETAASMETAVSFEKPAFWRPRIMLTLDNVVVREGRETLKTSSPNFNRMLERRDVLCNTGSLVRLIKLQEGLARRFGGRLESSLMESSTIAEFLYKYDADEWLRPLVEVFIRTFNNVRTELTASSFWGKQAIEFCKGQALTEAAPAGVLFASRHKSGSCAVALLRHLIEAHNAMVSGFTEDNQTSTVSVIPPSDLGEDQVVVFDEGELQLLLLANSEYELDVQGVGETRWGINLAQLEMSLADRFLMGRPLIDLSKAPHFTFQNDENEKRSKMAESIDQKPLPVTIKHQFETELRNIVDVCDLLPMMESVKDFVLATTGSAEDDVLPVMATLRMKLEGKIKGLDKIKFCYLDDFIAWLRLTRARLLIRHRHDPFSLLSEDFRMPVNPDDEEAVSAALVGFLPDAVAGLHAFVEDQVVTAVDNAEDTDELELLAGRKLGDYLYQYLDDSDQQRLAERVQGALPETVTVSQAAELFICLAKRSG